MNKEKLDEIFPYMFICEDSCGQKMMQRGIPERNYFRRPNQDETKIIKLFEQLLSDNN